MVKLFRAYSIRENYKNRDVVVVDWFCHARDEQGEPYDSYITNYHELGADDLNKACRRIDSFLTEPEIVELKRYMDRKFGFEVRIDELTIPFEDGRKIPNFSSPSAPSDEGEYIDLSEHKDYNLSIPIHGYCDLSEPPNLISGSWK